MFVPVSSFLCQALHSVKNSLRAVFSVFSSFKKVVLYQWLKRKIASGFDARRRCLGFTMSMRGGCSFLKTIRPFG
jgi:hypothetical protein